MLLFFINKVSLSNNKEYNYKTLNYNVNYFKMKKLSIMRVLY